MDPFGIKSSCFPELLWFLDRIASRIEARAFAKPSSTTSKLVLFCMQQIQKEIFSLEKWILIIMSYICITYMRYRKFDSKTLCLICAHLNSMLKASICRVSQILTMGLQLCCDALYAGKGEIRKLEGKMISLEVNDEKEKKNGEK